MDTIKNGFVENCVLENHCRNCGVPERLRFDGFDDEERLRELQAKSRELADALWQSRPCPLAIVERHSAAQTKLAGEALRLVEAYMRRLEGELQAARDESRRVLVAGIKLKDGTARALCDESLSIVALGGNCGMMQQAHIRRIEAVGVVAGQLRTNAQRPIWLQTALAAVAPPDPVRLWKFGK